MDHIEALGAGVHRITLAEDRQRTRMNRARWICDKRGINDEEGYLNVLAAITHEEFMQRIQPFIAMKVRMLQFEMPRYIVDPLGPIGAPLAMLPPVRSAAAQATLDQIDAVIAEIARDCGVPMPTTPPG
jgi:hypothetical protein